MSTREEQSAEIAAIIKREYVRAIDRKRIGDCYDAPADAIIAAGYSKPRTITTVDELDDASIGTVIRSEQGAVWERFGTYWFETSSTRAFRDEDIALPAIVLHEP